MERTLSARTRPGPLGRSVALLALTGLLANGPGCGAAPDEGTTGPGLAGIGVAGQSSGGPDEARRGVAHLPGGRTCRLEIADTPRSRQEGYMHRARVGEDEGMIFIFPEPGFHPFWMKNTLVPLDIIWMDEAFRVVHLETNVPPCKADPCPSYGPLRKARYVLELQGGSAAAQGVTTGATLSISLPQGVS